MESVRYDNQKHAWMPWNFAVSRRIVQLIIVMRLPTLNKLDPAEAAQLYVKCCTASAWVREMIERRPFDSLPALKQQASDVWETMQADDLLEAFAGHPKIGDLSSLKEKFHNTVASASREQSGVESASDAALEELARYNGDYEDKFGLIFIVFASGKSAVEMLDIIKARIHNGVSEEMLIAAGEQLKITQLRLDRLIDPND